MRFHEILNWPKPLDPIIIIWALIEFVEIDLDLISLYEFILIQNLT